MGKIIDLDQHFSILQSPTIAKVVAPLTSHFGIKHFRYLKLYPDKSRILLSNYPVGIQFIYESQPIEITMKFKYLYDKQNNVIEEKLFSNDKLTSITRYKYTY